MADPSRSLNILLTTLGSAGDVHPFIAIGRALLERGHRVTLVTSAYFHEAADRAGLDFIGLGSRDDYQRVVDEPDLFDPRRGFGVFARHVVVPAIRPTYDLLSANLGPDTVVVAQGQAFGAHLAHEKHGVAFVTISLQPAAFRTVHDFPLFPSWLPLWARPLVFRMIDFLLLDRELAAPINAIRAELGLTPVAHILGSWAHSPQGSIGLFPDWFGPPQPDWPRNTTLSGFVLLRQAASRPPAHLARFLESGKPPIVFTAGTEMKHARDFFRTSTEALSKLGRRGILLSRHTDHLPSPLPPGVITVPYVPFPDILPRSAAIVHHGGIGTIAEAFAAGIPQLVRPMAHDQPDNAARVQRLGVGLTLPPQQYTVPRVCESLQSLLDSEAVREACLGYAGRMSPSEPLARVCDTIEEVAARQRP
jgi:rhamnosyltransferase subunit B